MNEHRNIIWDDILHLRSVSPDAFRIPSFLLRQLDTNRSSTNYWTPSTTRAVDTIPYLPYRPIHRNERE